MAAKEVRISATLEAFARIVLAEVVHLEISAPVVWVATVTYVLLGLPHYLAQLLVIELL
jgi:hypothetical protein